MRSPESKSLSARPDLSNAAPTVCLDLADQLGQPVATIPAMLAARAALTPDSPAQWEQEPSGHWRPRTWRDFERRANDAAARLIGLGLRPGDRVGIIAPSSPDWDVAQFGILAAGGVVVGLDPHDVGERTREIIARCQIVGLVVGETATVEKLGDGVCSALRFVVSLDPTQSPGTSGLADKASVDENDPGSLPLSTPTLRRRSSSPRARRVRPRASCTPTGRSSWRRHRYCVRSPISSPAVGWRAGCRSPTCSSGC